MTPFERRVRTAVIHTLRDTGVAPDVAVLGATLGAEAGAVRTALHALADQHRLVLRPGTDAIWMAHPFSGVDTDFVVRIGARQWFANCVWDGLSILALLGDGTLETHSPVNREALRYEVKGGTVHGEGIVHFLVPARAFWDDIGFT